MKITLAKIEMYPNMSRETEAFRAHIHLDGKPVCEVMNTGQGGSHDYNPIGDTSYVEMRTKIRAMETWCASQTYSFDVDDIVRDHDLDSYTNELLNQHMLAEQFTASLKSALQKSVVIFRAETKQISAIQRKYSKDFAAKLRAHRLWSLKDVILNELPFAEALAIYVANVEVEYE